MTISYTPALLANLNNPTTAVTTINNNETSVQTAFVSALNTAGDKMQGTIDMNNNQIINLPAPTSNNSPARLVDLAPAGTTLISAVTYNNVQSVPPNTFIGNPTGVTANATAFSSLAQANAVFSASVGTQALNASTVTATTGTLTNFTATTISAGTTTTTNASVQNLTIQSNTQAASAGTIGEYVESRQLASIGLSNNAATNTLPGLVTLQPGDWDVWGHIQIFFPASNGILAEGYISNTANSNNAIDNACISIVEGVAAGNLSEFNATLGPVRQLINVPTTYTINVIGTVAANTMSCITSSFHARRWR